MYSVLVCIYSKDIEYDSRFQVSGSGQTVGGYLGASPPPFVSLALHQFTPHRRWLLPSVPVFTASP